MPSTTNMSNERVLASFCAHLQKKGRNRDTIQNYRTDLEGMIGWLTSQKLWPFSGSRKDDVALKGYRDHLIKTFKPATVNRKISAANVFFRWAADQHHLETQPMQLETLSLQDSSSRTWLTRQEQVNLLDAVRANGTLQDQIIVALLLQSGVRMTELCKLQWNQVHIIESGAHLKFAEPHARKVTIVPLSEQVSDQLIQFGYGEMAGSSYPLFTNGEKPITRRNIQILLERYARMAGATVTARTLHWTCAMNLAERQSKASRSKGHPGIGGFEFVDNDAQSNQVWQLESTHRWAAIRRVLVGPGTIDDSYRDFLLQNILIQGTKRIDSYVLVHSNVPPDPIVQKQVLRRAKGHCERCGISWGLANFLEVHHIIAASVKVDHYNNCVALCPNCHKEAHLASRNVAIETELLKFVRNFPAKAPPS